MVLKMKKYEYETWTMDSQRPFSLDRALKRSGENGWLVVACVPHPIKPTHILYTPAREIKEVKS